MRADDRLHLRRRRDRRSVQLHDDIADADAGGSRRRALGDSADADRAGIVHGKRDAKRSAARQLITRL